MIKNLCSMILEILLDTWNLLIFSVSQILSLSCPFLNFAMIIKIVLSFVPSFCLSLYLEPACLTCLSSSLAEVPSYEFLKFNNQVKSWLVIKASALSLLIRFYPFLFSDAINSIYFSLCTQHMFRSVFILIGLTVNS